MRDERGQLRRHLQQRLVTILSIQNVILSIKSLLECLALVHAASNHWLSVSTVLIE